MVECVRETEVLGMGGSGSMGERGDDEVQVVKAACTSFPDGSCSSSEPNSWYLRFEVLEAGSCLMLSAHALDLIELGLRLLDLLR